jgi:hypothetical protein
MANYGESYSSSWKVRTVDVSTWDDSGEVEGITSVSISKDCTDDVPLLETGSMSFDGQPDFGWSWCRIYMTTEQATVERHAVATLLFERSSSKHDKGSTTVTANGRSVLQPAADRKMARGAYAAAGSDGAALVGNLLRECTPAPVSIEGSFTLVDDVVFDLGCSYLDAVWALLKAVGWCIQIDGMGVIHVRPKPMEPALELSRTNAGLLLPGIEDDYSLVDVPNRYYAVDDDEVAVAVNDDPSSATGYQARGRWIDVVDESPTLVDGETLESYAQRRLAEESAVTRTYKYKREWDPNVNCFDLVRATLASNGIAGDLRVMKQEITCKNGIVVEETVGESDDVGIGSGLADLIEAMVDRKIAKAAEGGEKETAAKVVAIDVEGKVWVSIPGSESPTPVRRTAVEVSTGDRVSVTVSNGRAVIDSNISNPSAGMARMTATQRVANDAMGFANVANAAAMDAKASAEEASDQAANALASANNAANAASAAWSHADDAANAASAAWDHADDAANAANAAWELADNAGDAADAAWERAGNALVAAGSAQSSADAAAQSAVQANMHANDALDQLGFVQDVVGVLTWASEHGSFELTEDESVQDGKVYFTYDSTSGDYTPVVDPQASALGTYYELTVDEAMDDFIMSHLAVTQRGLWVLPSGIATGSVTPATGEAEADARARLGDNYKMLLGNDGTYIYDGYGDLVAQYKGDGITYAEDKPFHIGNEDAFIFYTPASGNTPAHITLGGSYVEFGSTSLSDLLADVQSAVQTANDVPIVTLSSTNGTVFKRSVGVSTTLVATVFTPGGRIDNATELHRRFGNGAYLEWGWRDVVTDASHVLLSSDTRIGNGGFTLTVGPDDIDSQAVITCSLNY